MATDALGRAGGCGARGRGAGAGAGGRSGARPAARRGKRPPNIVGFAGPEATRGSVLVGTPNCRRSVLGCIDVK